MAAAITFPLALADFAEKLGIQSVTPEMQRNDQIDGLESGLILASETAPPLRKYTVNIRSCEYGESDQIDAIVESLDGSLQPFYMFLPPRLYPQADPTGAILGASAVTISVLDADNKRMTLAGLPAAYKLTSGDFLSFAFGGAANLYALHRIVNGAVAAGGTAQIEVRPHIHPGTVTTTPVKLIKPMMKAIMVPGSYNYGEVRAQRVEGKSFQIIERY